MISRPETFTAVRACALALLAGAVLQTAGVSAGNGIVVDWREVKSGETLNTDGDAFDTAQLFVALVGPEAALAIVEGEPAAAFVPAIHAYPLQKHADGSDSDRIREFRCGGYQVQVSRDWIRGGDFDDADQADFVRRLASLAAEVSS